MQKKWNQLLINFGAIPKNRDKNDLIYSLKTKKIFLLSSINDEEVKDNLSSEKKNKQKFKTDILIISNFNQKLNIFWKGKMKKKKNGFILMAGLKLHKMYHSIIW